jgi:hypothetical protein
MRDAMILQAALSHAAVHKDVVNCREPSKLAVMLTEEAIRLINERMEAIPLTIDNYLIGAIALVACNSVSVHPSVVLTVLTTHVF